MKRSVVDVQRAWFDGDVLKSESKLIMGMMVDDDQRVKASEWSDGWLTIRD